MSALLLAAVPSLGAVGGPLGEEPVAPYLVTFSRPPRGDNAVFLARHGFDVTGVDNAPSAIAKARRKAEAAGVAVRFEVDDLTNLKKVQGPFDLLVDYGTLDDLSRRDRDLYVANVLPLARPGTLFLLWCFEWRLRWWERIAGAASLSGWPRGFAAYLMTAPVAAPGAPLA